MLFATGFLNALGKRRARRSATSRSGQSAAASAPAARVPIFEFNSGNSYRSTGVDKRRKIEIPAIHSDTVRSTYPPVQAKKRERSDDEFHPTKRSRASASATSVEENSHPNIRPHYYAVIDINNGAKRRKAEATSNNVTAYPSAAIHATKVSKRNKRKTNERSKQGSNNVFPPAIFLSRGNACTFAASEKKASKKRRSDTIESIQPAQKKIQVQPPLVTTRVSTSASHVASYKRTGSTQKKKMMIRASLNKNASIFNHRGAVTSANKFTFIEEAVPVQENVSISDRPHRDEVANGVAPDNMMELIYSSDSNSDSEEDLVGADFLPEDACVNNDIHMEYSDSDDDDSSSSSSLIGSDILPDLSFMRALIKIQALFRGTSIRTMKPRARPQAKLELDVQHGDQQWDRSFDAASSDDLFEAGQEADEESDAKEEAAIDAASDADDDGQSSVNHDTGSFATDVDAADANLFDAGQEADEESDAKEEAAIDDALDVDDDDQSTVNHDTGNYAAEANVEAIGGEQLEEEGVDNEEEVEVVQPAPQRRRMVAELQSTLDGWYWTRATQRRKLVRD